MSCDEETNLITLCTACHYKAHQRQIDGTYNHHQRQLEGIAKAQAKGTKFGRPSVLDAGPRRRKQYHPAGLPAQKQDGDQRMRGNKLHVDQTKIDSLHSRAFARGGQTKMFGKQAAGPDKPGNTGKDQTAAPGPKRAQGGPPVARGVGGRSRPARAGQVGT
jgi:hypothetical protein